jgi:HK97 gp10 family phage protein
MAREAATVAGADELIARLRTFKKVKSKKAIRKGSRKGSKIVQAKAKANVPVKSGALQKAIKVRAIKRSRKWAGTTVTTKVAQGPTYYGGFIEYGTKYIKARHFIKQAFEQSRASAGRAFVDGITEELAKP